MGSLIHFVVSTHMARSFSKRLSMSSFNGHAAFPYETIEECRNGGPEGSSAVEEQLTTHLQRSLLGFPYSALNRIQMEPNKKLFFAMNLHNAAEVIPLLLSAVMKVCLFFASPEQGGACYISIYESGSTDATRALLDAFAVDLRVLSIPHTITLWGKERDADQHRIAFLADMRNEALAPLFDNSTSWDEIVFLNDVIMCASSLLELIRIKRVHRADITSGMDYIYLEPHGIIFYDTWVNKDIAGMPFRNVMPFVQDEISWRRYNEMEPFQVFTTWAGGVVVSASLLTASSIRFRHSKLLECASCECELFIRDLWNHMGATGLKVLVVPSVFVSYKRYDFRMATQFFNSNFPSFKTARVPKASQVLFNRTSPEAFECAGMEFSGEQLIDFDNLVTFSSWKWGYDSIWNQDVQINRSLSSIMKSAFDFYRKDCPIGGENLDSSLRRIPRLLNFVLPTGNPTKFPHVAFMNALEWVRLNPCYETRIYSIEEIHEYVPSKWQNALKAIVGLPDPFTRFLESYDRYRVICFIVLYLNGGVVADLELAPTRSLDLSEMNDFEAAFDVRAYGHGPYMMAAVPRYEKLGKLINDVLSVRDLSDKVGATLKKALSSQNLRSLTAAHFLDILSSERVGKMRFYKSGLLGAHTSNLQHYGVLRLYNRGLYVNRQSIAVMMDKDILVDGEFLVSASMKICRSNCIWLSAQKKVLHDGELKFLWLRSSQIYKQHQGCLEIRSDLSDHANDILWQKCWSRSKERGFVYMEYESGELNVYTTEKSCASSTRGRTILWSSNSRTTPAASANDYELSLTFSGLLQSAFVRPKRTRKDPGPSNRCRVDLFDIAECNNFFNHSHRQLIRYRQMCDSVH